MNESIARKIIGHLIQPDNTLFSVGYYISWDGGDEITIDCGNESVDDIIAIAWWITNMKVIK